MEESVATDNIGGDPTGEDVFNADGDGNNKDNISGVNKDGLRAAAIHNAGQSDVHDGQDGLSPVIGQEGLIGVDVSD
eukprot:4110043-Ditylum_brightwellii.AAC.1